MKERISKLVTDLEVKYSTALETIKTEGQALFKDSAKELFEAYPELHSFKWNQYTPYFNDGDECLFHVNEVHNINGYDEYEDEYAEGNIFSKATETIWRDSEKAYNPAYNPRSRDIVELLNMIIRGLPKESMKSMFGDHAEITVTREGIEVDGYDHD